MTTSMGGLGRGLAAILTGPDSTEDNTLRARLVESAIASLTSDRTLRLCGYIHSESNDVSVTLRSPEVRSLHPTEAFRLFTVLGGLVEAEIGRHSFRVGDLSATAVLTQTGGSRGLFFFGDPNLDEATTNRLAAFCQAFAPAIHEHNRPPDDSERIHLVLDQEGGDTHAEITIDGRSGFSSAANAEEAVASAAISAVSENAKLVDVGEVRAGDGAAAFVVAAGEMGRAATGAAPVDSGPGTAVAVAAIRAARGLAVVQEV